MVDFFLVEQLVLDLEQITLHILTHTTLFQLMQQLQILTLTHYLQAPQLHLKR
jgi:hypothetical protein